MLKYKLNKFLNMDELYCSFTNDKFFLETRSIEIKNDDVKIIKVEDGCIMENF